MKPESAVKARPAWIGDAKWVVGILAFFVVAATALVMSLTKLTEREPALTMMSTVMATLMSPQGLDDPGDADKLRAHLKAVSPGASFEPIPGVSITAADIEGKSPRELRLMIFRRLAEPIYDRSTFASAGNFSKNGNTPGVNLGTNTPGVNGPPEPTVASAATADQLGVLVLLGNESHQRVLSIQTILLGVSVGLLLLLIYLSTGFGRLASPGWVLVLVAAVPTTLTFLIQMSLRTHPPAPPTGEPSIATVAASAATDVAPTILVAVASVYRPLLLVGIGLVLIATIGGITWHGWRSRTEPA